MTGALAVVIVIGAVIALWVALSLISTLTDKGVDFAGRAIGNALKPSTAQARRQGELTLSRPGEEICGQLVSVGALDPSSSCLVTSSGVVVEITVPAGSARLTCRWNPAVADKPMQIMGDVLRAVRQVDVEAQVVL